MRTRFALAGIALITLLLAGCAWLNPLGNLAVGESVIPRADPPPMQPDWLNNERLVSTSGSLEEVYEFKASSGARAETHPYTVTGVTNSFHIGASADGNRVVFCVAYDGTVNTDVVLYTLSAESTTILATADGFHHSPSFLDANNVIFTEFDYSVANLFTNRVVKYNLDTDATETIIETSGAATDNTPQDDYFYLSKASPGGTRVLVAAWDQVLARNSFQVYNASTGALVYDGFTFGDYDRVAGADFLDENTVIVCAGGDADYSYYIVDTSTGTLVNEIALTDTRIMDMYGANVSPDGTMVASHFAEIVGGEFVRNWLIVTRIAAPVE